MYCTQGDCGFTNLQVVLVLVTYYNAMYLCMYLVHNVKYFKVFTLKPASREKPLYCGRAVSQDRQNLDFIV